MFAAALAPPSSLPQACAVRARLWLKPAELGAGNPGANPHALAGVWHGPAVAAEPADNDARLWLHLGDGRVLAFRLPAAHFGDDRVIAPLAAAVADDARGMLLELRDAAFGYAIPLYAASPTPMPALAWGHPGHEAARAFAGGLDQDVLRLLARLERGRAFSSVRNYNRLAALPAELRERRMQAIDRFPVLVAPILLTAHRHLECAGGKRHAWRNPDSHVAAAIDRGRDLIGALAARYGISRGLVRSPVCAAMWGTTAIPPARLLQLIDGIPAHRRPRHPDEIERTAPGLAWLNQQLDEHVDLLPLGQTTFKAGWNTVWEACERHFPNLQHALADTRDFLLSAAERAEHIGATPAPMGVNALALAWLTLRGLPSLLKASARWHLFILCHRHLPSAPNEGLLAVLGEYHRDAVGAAQELVHFGALAREGEEMRHCVAEYWADCVEDGTRIFRLTLASGERATGEFRCSKGWRGLEFHLAQVRGPLNAEASASMQAFARSVEAELNAPERRPNRQRLNESLTQPRRGAAASRRPRALLDPAGEAELAAVLDHLAALPAYRRWPGELLRTFVAGYMHHGGATVDEFFAVGEELALVREPDNPYDHLAVRIDWRSVKLGYVPRANNAEIARRLDAGERLACRIGRANLAREHWARLEFVVLDPKATPS